MNRFLGLLLSALVAITPLSSSAFTKSVIWTSSTTSPQTLPADWCTTNNQIIAIGAGGSGFKNTSNPTSGGGGGGAGAGCTLTNFADPAGTSEAIVIGAGGTTTQTQFR